MAGELSWFELGVGDVERARKFYGELLGWKFEGPAGDGGGYSIDTGGVIPGGIHGGDAGASPYVFFEVEDMDSTLARVRELGGEADDMPGQSDESKAEYGRFALCKDDQGSSFGLHAPPAGG